MERSKVVVLLFFVHTGKVEPEELVVFYDAWKSVLSVNKLAQMLAGFKGVEVNNNTNITTRWYDVLYTDNTSVLQ